MNYLSSIGAVDIPDDCPLTLTTNPSVYRKLILYFQQYFGSNPTLDDDEEDKPEEIVNFTT